MVDLVTLAPSLALVLGLLVLSAFFSSSESAIFSLTPEAVRDLAESGAGGGDDLSSLRGNPHRLLVTILVGNNVVNIAMSAVTTLLLVEFLPPAWVAPVSTVVVSSLILVFGEIVPKSYGLGNAESWSLRVARPLRLTERTLGPLVSAFDAVTRYISRLVGGETDIESYIED